MVLISRPEIQRMLRMLYRSEGFCRNARSSFPFNAETDIHAEPTDFYPGASGYAGATMRDVINTLELHMSTESHEVET